MAPAEGRGSSPGPGTRGALSHVWMGEIQTMAVESLPGLGAGSPGQGVSQGSERESIPGRPSFWCSLAIGVLLGFTSVSASGFTWHSPVYMAVSKWPLFISTPVTLD